MGLAVWIWHITDTGRYGTIKTAISNLDKANGTSSINEFHLIAGAIAISGLLFLLSGLAVEAWSRTMDD